MLHVGCADAPYTKRKLERCTLLHQKIDQASSRTIGIDLDQAAVIWLNDQGFKDVYCANAEDVRSIMDNMSFEPDVVLAGEILEHLYRPAAFLEGVKALMVPATELVITVPNAFCLMGIIHMILGREKVHSEHVAYYSYRTIQEFLVRADLTLLEIVPFVEKPRSAAGRFFDFVARPLLFLRPHFATGYVVVARLS